jgi:hypothetical protein
MKNMIEKEVHGAGVETGPSLEMNNPRRVWMSKTRHQLKTIGSGATILSLILTVASLTTTGCQPGPAGAPGPRGESGASGTVTTAGNNSSPSGGSSDGGGFVSENSKILLESVSKRLAMTIRNSSPVIFRDVPAEWNHQKIADAIEHIRLTPLKTHTRAGKDLMFNFGKDTKGPYIEALMPFFAVYGSVPVKFMKSVDLTNIRHDIELKLLHEVAHLWDADEAASEQFGMQVVRSFERDMIMCKAKLHRWLIQRGRNRMIVMIGDESNEANRKNPEYFTEVLFPSARTENFDLRAFDVAQADARTTSAGYFASGLDWVATNFGYGMFVDGKTLRSSPEIIETAALDFTKLIEVVRQNGSPMVAITKAPALRIEFASTPGKTVFKSVTASDGQPVTCDAIY